MDVRKEIEDKMKKAIINIELYREKMKIHQQIQYFLNVFNDVSYQQNMNYYFDDQKTMLAKEDSWNFSYSIKKDNKKESSLLHDKCMIKTQQEKNEDIEIILSLNFFKQKEHYLEASNSLLAFSEKALNYANNINEMYNKEKLPSEKTILCFLNEHKSYQIIRAIYLIYLPIENLNEVLKIAIKNKIDIKDFLTSEENIRIEIERTLEINKSSVVPIPIKNIISAIMKNISEKQQNISFINSFIQKNQLKIILPINNLIYEKSKI